MKSVVATDDATMLFLIFPTHHFSSYLRALVHSSMGACVHAWTGF
jgi:hypothetical protein